MVCFVAMCDGKSIGKLGSVIPRQHNVPVKDLTLHRTLWDQGFILYVVCSREKYRGKYFLLHYVYHVEILICIIHYSSYCEMDVNDRIYLKTLWLNSFCIGPKSFPFISANYFEVTDFLSSYPHSLYNFNTNDLGSCCQFFYDLILFFESN